MWAPGQSCSPGSCIEMLHRCTYLPPRPARLKARPCIYRGLGCLVSVARYGQSPQHRDITKSLTLAMRKWRENEAIRKIKEAKEAEEALLAEELGFREYRCSLAWAKWTV